MGPFPLFVVKIVRAAAGRPEARVNMTIVIRRAFEHLETELRQAFEGQRDVQVIVDRRHGERRRRSVPVTSERRHADRRVQIQEIAEVTFSD
jgi:hypothetical protein